MTRTSLITRLKAAISAAAAAWRGPPAAGGPVAAAPAARRPSSTAGLEQLLRLFKHSDSGLLVCHRDDRLVLGSPVAARLFGVDPPAMRDTPVSQWLEPLAGARSASTGSRNDEDTPGSAFFSGQWETIAHRADGSSFPAEVTVTETQLDGRAQRVMIVRDITDRRLTQERLMQLANFDNLTGLPNRTLFRDRLAQAMARARRSRVPMVLMFLDLDNFKVINDSLGHEVGDQLLRHVAQMLESCLRDTDTVAHRSAPGPEAVTVSRLGGDEFTIIAEQVASAEDAALLAKRVLEAVATPLQLLEHELHVSASIGISMFPVDDTDLDGLVRHTDMAMYRSKAMGRGVYSFYSRAWKTTCAARSSARSLRCTTSPSSISAPDG